mmetsp:Transcript_12346/g.27426  ORF Transcript_12346/g.27426 Transcript_12346/m.27426 type:complete len:202 (+) Transcript_12346:307-912(+)
MLAVCSARSLSISCWQRSYLVSTSWCICWRLEHCSSSLASAASALLQRMLSCCAEGAAAASSFPPAFVPTSFLSPCRPVKGRSNFLNLSSTCFMCSASLASSSLSVTYFVLGGVTVRWLPLPADGVAWPINGLEATFPLGTSVLRPPILAQEVVLTFPVPLGAVTQLLAVGLGLGGAVVALGCCEAGAVTPLLAVRLGLFV